MEVTIAILCFVVGVAAFEKNNFAENNEVFRKCCPKEQILIRIIQIESLIDRYECIDDINAINDFGISKYPLISSENIVVQYGVPECTELRIIENILVDEVLDVSSEQCYDRLVLETFNGTSKQIIPEIIALTCNSDETYMSNVFKSNLKIDHIRKCCAKGKDYDMEYHMCRDSDVESRIEELISHLNPKEEYIYKIDENGLHCKSDEFAVELNEDMVSFQFEGTNLNVLSSGRDLAKSVLEGGWCFDREFSTSKFIVRVCTKDCSAFGALCIRKCCPVGEHYRPRRCGSPVSTCVPTIDDSVLFNITSYLEPLKNNGDFDGVLGIRTELRCPQGKFVLNKYNKSDEHWLTSAGDLKWKSGSKLYVGPDYCLETFDKRLCEDDIVVTAAACFIKSLTPTKNFYVSFLLNTLSIICLTLTLVVYCVLPELRNLHGRTLICHVSTMLLAYSCLARVQYDFVSDRRMCTLLGYGIYFGFVAAFAWLNVMCFDIWWTFGSVRSVQPLRKSNSERRRFLWYSLYAWSVAVLMTLITLLLDLYPIANALDANIGSVTCWFGVENNETDWAHLILFVVPMGFVTCTNFVLWVLTARHCARIKSEVHRLQAGSVSDRVKKTFRIDRAKYILTGKLWVVMGAGWASEMLSTLAMEPQWFWNIIDLFNELQGVFIFLILVLKPKFYYIIRKRLGLDRPGTEKTTSSSSARTSTTFLSRTISNDERAHQKRLISNPKQS